MNEVEYVAYELDGDGFREFFSSKEASDFFGIKENSLKVIARDRHTVKGTLESTWAVFSGDISVKEVESVLGRSI